MTPISSIPKNPVVRRLAAAGAIVLVAWLIAMLPRTTATTRAILDRANEFFYDTYYRLRPITSRTDGPVVIVAVDDRSLKAVNETLKYGWPWPRELWGHIVTYLDKAGAKAVAFDLLFSETSVYQDRTGDDDTFAELMGQVKVPIVFGSLVSADGKWGPFAPKLKGPTFGAVNVGDDKTFRRYPPTVYGQLSLAARAVKSAGREPQLPADHPFLLHYYGPHQASDGTRTHRFISAASVLAAQIQGEEAAKAAGITPELFRDKIVIIGAITAGTYDLKSSPLSTLYPGVEVQATAIENLLAAQEVRMVPTIWGWLAPLLGAALTTAGVMFPRRAWAKTLGPILAAAGIVGAGILLFHGSRIHWLPPVASLLAVAFASLGAFSWVFFAEDRQRRFMLKALSKVVSPAVAERLAREPERLTLGTVRTDITVLFTDLENFTGMSESMDVQKLGEMLNRYLGEMSDQVLLNHGTLDKYIGDAIMCFWNAPLPQADHAILACRAALGIMRREREIEPELKRYGIPRIHTRIGINTTTVSVGFVGSSHLFNYTAVGDGVNLGSRLEGANKFYGTRIMLSETTAEAVKDHFLIRKIDVLRVKGKHKPMAVYQLMAEKGTDGHLEPLIRGYESAFAKYQLQQWDEAEKVLLELNGHFADDEPCRALLKRIEHLRVAPPPADWDGVYTAKDK
ncbi:MAG: CHASE2 domain-containing protein [Bacillota bacterium]